MRYLLIDRIQYLEFNKQILATKNVALSEDVYSDHFFGFPVMPGALLIESLAQAGTALLEVSANYRKKALLVMVQQAKFRSLVQPGDQLSIDMKMHSLDDNYARMDGTVHVAQHLVMNASLTFALKNSEEFHPSKTRHLMETIYDIWLRDAQLVGLQQGPGNEKSSRE